MAQETAFSPLCVQLIRTGEESGTLDNMLARLGQWHTEQTQDRADTLAAALEPAMMSLMGGIVGTLTIALYLPVFRLGEAISMG
ncbi:type II secretion system F family protein [Apirhabdus apintestini]|nr:type II secretion system F family protein [Enterobacteriaceae bacterium CA-0114]